MEHEIRMAELQPGERAVVTGMAVGAGIRRRLQDIGLIKGTEITCVSKSPLGDPKAYLIRKAVIALRSEDAGEIQVKRRQEEEFGEKRW